MMFIVGDATALPLPDASMACIVSSPPYNVGLDYNGYDDALPWDEYATMAESAAAEMARVLVPGGRCWINVQPTVPVASGDRRRVDLVRLWGCALGRVLHYRDMVAWVQDAHDGGCAWGSWLSPSAPNQRGGWEAVLCYYRGPDWKRSPPPSCDGWRDERHNLGGDWSDLCRNVWRIVPSRRTSGPAPFPEDLAARCIRLSTWPGEFVLDPFAGTGTTARVAAKLGRVGISVDIAEGEVARAVRRSSRH